MVLEQTQSSGFMAPLTETLQNNIENTILVSFYSYISFNTHAKIIKLFMGKCVVFTFCSNV